MDWVKDVTYGAAGQLMQMRSFGSGSYLLETRQYNARLQMTRLQSVQESGLITRLDMEYIYSLTNNNGRITSHHDPATGEQVTFQYDSLQRLILAETAGTEWGNSYGYDGFGNLLSKAVTKGNAPNLSINVNAATNRITSSGYGYDANGNMTQVSGQPGTFVYDVENRVTCTSQANCGAAEQYGYGPDNKRVWKRKANGTEEVYFYGVGGQRLGVYVASVYRDASGLDYDDQRFYASTLGRFLTPDPTMGSLRTVNNPANPQSWNRYLYALGDPVNYRDPSGLRPENCEDDADNPASMLRDWARSALESLTGSAVASWSYPASFGSGDFLVTLHPAAFDFIVSNGLAPGPAIEAARRTPGPLWAKGVVFVVVVIGAAAISRLAEWWPQRGN